MLRLKFSAVAVGPARRRIRGELADAGVASPVLDDVEVVASELLGNAVRHARAIAGGVLLLGWRIEDGEVTVRVTDGGSGRAVERREAGLLSDSGRGLHIIETLASSWGVVDHAGGLRTVWAAVPLRRTPRPGLRIVR
ncbi:MAG: ATP-binding protein [Kineosporiaceae bacterium]